MIVKLIKERTTQEQPQNSAPIASSGTERIYHNSHNMMIQIELNDLTYHKWIAGLFSLAFQIFSDRRRRLKLPLERALSPYIEFKNGQQDPLSAFVNKIVCDAAITMKCIYWIG